MTMYIKDRTLYTEEYRNTSDFIDHAIISLNHFGPGWALVVFILWLVCWTGVLTPSFKICVCSGTSTDMHR